MTAIAAVKASEADLLNIETCMRRTTEVRNDEDWIKWDGAFHSAIAKATRNDVLVGLITAFNQARSSGDWQALRLATITPENDAGRSPITARSATCCASDPPMMRSRAMRDHLLTTQRNLFE